MKLLSKVQGIDVCLSGRTHNRLFKPALQGKTLVIQSGRHGSFLGHLDLEIEGGRVVDYRHHTLFQTFLSAHFKGAERFRRNLAKVAALEREKGK